LTHSRLAELNLTTGTNVSIIVDKVEDRGLVQRGPHADDRRRKLVSLSPSGRDAIATAEVILGPSTRCDHRSHRRRTEPLDHGLQRVVGADESQA
jgi:DNA-binding MarR family transcriptional regulator